MGNFLRYCVPAFVVGCFFGIFMICCLVAGRDD